MKLERTRTVLGKMKDGHQQRLWNTNSESMTRYAGGMRIIYACHQNHQKQQQLYKVSKENTDFGRGLSTMKFKGVVLVTFEDTPIDWDWVL